jgi:hypothetical protein
MPFTKHSEIILFYLTYSHDLPVVKSAKLLPSGEMILDGSLLVVENLHDYGRNLASANINPANLGSRFLTLTPDRLHSVIVVDKWYSLAKFRDVNGAGCDAQEFMTEALSCKNLADSLYMSIVTREYDFQKLAQIFQAGEKPWLQ